MPGGKGLAVEHRGDLQGCSHGKALLHRGGFSLNRNCHPANDPHCLAGLALHPWPGTLPWRREALPSIPPGLDSWQEGSSGSLGRILAPHKPPHP